MRMTIGKRIAKVSVFVDAVSYRLPRPVTKVIRLSSEGYCFPVCPRCEISMDREYVGFCDRCGQRLDWKRLNNAEIVFPATLE